MARMHCPPTYVDWPIVLNPIKKHLWKTASDEYDLSPDREAGILLKANISWKGWKYRLRKAYDKFETNAERMETINLPKRIKKEDWEKFIEICSTGDEQIKREKGKASREHMKLPHTSDRHGCARIEDDLIKESPNGIVTRTKLFVATHSSKDGSCPFPTVKPSLDEIKRLVSLDPYLGNRDLDNDTVAKVYGRDGKGRVRGLGTGVTKTVVHAAAPYKKIAEGEKRKRAITDENSRLVMQHFNEESTARKILEEKMAVFVHDHSELGSSSQASRSPRVHDDATNVPPVTHCLLKNFRRRIVVLGSVSSDAISVDSYSITIDDIFDCTTELYVGEGTLADVSIGDTITWPKTFVESI
ncbi:hypothetical protein IFM89_031631 [Coptis chinensis]|uniref:Transposase n=1 Tax=Coptis chinensis TaxID=261450 RepID=A0A835HAC6_9MAGN|nr:hypothetical protein IFM89_031631 [Coptis chinensis]